MKNAHPYENAEALVFELESALKPLGIEIQPDSILERMCLNVTDLVYQKYDSSLRPDGKVDIRPSHRNLIGISDLATKIVQASKKSGFSKLKPHLEILNASLPTQNSFSSVLDQGNNKLFELLIACLCLDSEGTDVDLDNPNISTGANPDVIATFDGVRWGFACKALHSAKGMTIFENLKKAVEQIQASPARRGIPILNAKNILPHDEFWPVISDPEVPGEIVFSAYPGTKNPIEALRHFAREINRATIRAAGEDAWFDLFSENPKCVPAYLTYLPTVTATWMEGKIMTTRLNMFYLSFHGPIDPAAQRVLDGLNNSLQGMANAWKAKDL